MFEHDEKVCILNECGQFVKCTFQSYVDENKCRLLVEQTDNDELMTVSVNDVTKLSEVLDGITKNINEAYAMIDHMISIGSRAAYSKYEINAWRRCIQANKNLKRRLKS